MFPTTDREDVQTLTPHDTDLRDLLTNLQTDASAGLTGSEAASRLARDGENRLREKKKKSMLVIYK